MPIAIHPFHHSRALYLANFQIVLIRCTVLRWKTDNPLDKKGISVPRKCHDWSECVVRGTSYTDGNFAKTADSKHPVESYPLTSLQRYSTISKGTFRHDFPKTFNWFPRILDRARVSTSASFRSILRNANGHRWRNKNAIHVNDDFFSSTVLNRILSKGPSTFRGAHTIFHANTRSSACPSWSRQFRPAFGQTFFVLCLFCKFSIISRIHDPPKLFEYIKKCSGWFFFLNSW